jgi:hypothetical protein
LEVKNDIEGWSQTLKLPLRWVSFADHYGITRRGTRPRPNPPVFVKRSFAELMASSDRYDRSRTTVWAASDPLLSCHRLFVMGRQPTPICKCNTKEWLHKCSEAHNHRTMSSAFVLVVCNNFFSQLMYFYQSYKVATGSAYFTVRACKPE